MAGALDEAGARERARRSLCVMGMVNFPLSHAADGECAQPPLLESF